MSKYAFINEFNNLPEQERKLIVDKFIELYKNQALDIPYVAELMNVDKILLQHIVSVYKIKKTRKEIAQSIKNKNLRLYGVENVWQLESTKEKSRKTKLEKYGNENFTNVEKMKATNLERYGNECSLYGENIREKVKNKNIGNFGTEFPFQSDEIQLKVQKTQRNKHAGKLFIETDDFKISSQKYLDSHNVTTNMFIPEVRNKLNETNNSKYGVPWYCMTDDCRKSNGHTISQVNKRFAKLLKENNIEFEQEYAIENKSYDFKVGNILLEINPTYTHNSTYPIHYKNSKPLPKDYHLNKSLLAQKYNFRCIHIWDWDDINKIISLLLPKQKLYARNCEIREVSKQECDEFLNNYHLQNTCRGQKISYGLYYNNKLIQIMTFGKPRYNKKYEWELLRLCTHKNYMLIGGSERLWKHFLRQQNPLNVISYCDFSKFSGEVYERLGLIRTNKYLHPSTLWYNGKDLIRDTLLHQLGFDKIFGTNYGKGTDNYQLMKDNNFLEICDSGQITYAYN